MSDRVILIVESNPKDTQRLKVNNEKRAIRDALRLTNTHQQFTLEIENAARIKDLGDAIARFNPEIIHFMGHGEGESGLCFEGEDARKQLLANPSIDQIFELASSSVKFVFLNACYSEIQAKIIAKHIDHVVGMNNKIPDTTALGFAEQFYHYIGLNKSVSEAFKWAKAMSKAHELEDHLVPVLLNKSDYENHDYSQDGSKISELIPKPFPLPKKAETFIPNSPLLLIPTSPDYKLIADKHYREVESELDSRWGLLNARRVSTLTNLQRELGMDAPNVVYIYTKIENGRLLLDSDKHGNTIDLDELAVLFNKEGLRPLLILVLHGYLDTELITDVLKEQTRFIWCLNTRQDTALDELTKTIRLFFDRSSQSNSVELHKLISGLMPPSIIRSTCIKGFNPIELKVDAQSQRIAQQFRAALLRIMLGREATKSTLGLAIQQHLGNSGVFIFAVAGTTLSCVFDLPQQIHYKMLPKSNQQGVLIINWPLHIQIDEESFISADGWESRSSIYEVIHHNINHGSADLSELITQKAKAMGISAKTGAIVFHWNISVNTELTETQLRQWLTIWAEMIGEKFGDLYSPEATLVHALCFKINDTNNIETLNKQIQRFVVSDIAKIQSLTAYSQRNKPLGSLEAEEIEDFFNHEANLQWSEYFRFKDFNVDAYRLSEWVCEKTSGEFEEVVRTLWQAQQSNYQEFSEEAMS